MTEQVRYRIPKKLVKEAGGVFGELGVTPSQAVAMFFAQVVKLRGFPFRPSEFPALEEYGVSSKEAEAVFAEARKELAADKKSGRVVKFSGKLP